MMKTKALFYVTIFVTVLCFIVSGSDLAWAIINLNEGNLIKSIVFILLALWLFYGGIRNAKNLRSLWMMIKWEKRIK